MPNETRISKSKDQGTVIVRINLNIPDLSLEDGLSLFVLCVDEGKFSTL
ncbi:MAG TPA: hypothetical protein PKY81_02770 [bacterium]|nr:hypothetical protein [bacterium]